MPTLDTGLMRVNPSVRVCDMRFGGFGSFAAGHGP